MIEAKVGSATSQTPWGLTWAQLFSSIRPTESHLNKLSSLITNLDDLLKAASIGHDRLIPAGSYGKQTMYGNEQSLELYVLFRNKFDASNYFDAHLKPLADALTDDKSGRYIDVSENGFALSFATDGISVRLSAAGEFYAGPKDLLLFETFSKPSLPTDGKLNIDQCNGITTDSRQIHVETTCAVYRTNFIASQSKLYQDMVRVAKKWRASNDFISRDDIPGDYLLELVMLEAVQSAPVSDPTPDFYVTIFRRFLSIMASKCGSGSDVTADHTMPPTFLSWTSLYNKGAIDDCIARGMLDINNKRSDLCSLVIVDPAAPFINVARTVADWGEIRSFARGSLVKFQSSELLETLQTKLEALTQGMGTTIKTMQEKLDQLHVLEESPRRWSGNIQFTEVHINQETWNTVLEVELRCVTWRVNARKARVEDAGYNTRVDISLQAVGNPLARQLDVDVVFRGALANLSFGPNQDHVLIVKRSDIIRNRDYSMQITVVA